MKELARRVGVVCAVLLSSFVSGQQPNVAAVMPPDVSAPDQISFLVRGDSNPVSQRVQLISVQVRTGKNWFHIIVAPSQAGEVYNLSQVDSATSLIFCADNHRYALPDSRFLIHGSILRQAPRNTSERFRFSF